MFDNYPGAIEGSECKPDYAAQAERLATRIRANKSGLSAMQNFVEDGDFHSLHRKDQATVYAIIGGLTMLIPRQEAEHVRLISKIEQEA